MSQPFSPAASCARDPLFMIVVVAALLFWRRRYGR